MTGVADPGSTPDLSVVLTRLMARGYRASEESRRALANDRGTRAFLEAGLTLIAEEIGLGAGPAPAERDDVPRPFFDWLSLTKVVEQARHEGPASLAMLRDRWPARSDFIEDLMAYSLWSVQWAPDTERARNLAGLLTRGGNLVDVADQLGYEILAARATDRAQRVALLVTAIAGQDPPVRALRADLYKADHDTYQVLVETVRKVWRTKTRPEVEPDDFINVMHALLEGLVLRSIFDPEGVIDHEARRSLFGKAAMMLIAGAGDPGDGLTLSEAVRRLSEA
jgi:hypothetical protein